jgi:hypothetical protein
MIAAVAFKSTGATGDGLIAASDGAAGFAADPHALTNKPNVAIKKNIFFMPISFCSF